jgi:protease-4
VDANSYLRNVKSVMPPLIVGPKMIEQSFGPRVGIIHFEGTIAFGKSYDLFVDRLKRASCNPNILAVVLRLNSPGGDSVASHMLWREIRLCSRIKPVVVSVVSIAASGGYLLSCACDQIVCEEMSLTGSIGVFALHHSLEKLYSTIDISITYVSIVYITHIG